METPSFRIEDLRYHTCRAKNSARNNGFLNTHLGGTISASVEDGVFDEQNSTAD
jgi:hypothetical protein